MKLQPIGTRLLVLPIEKENFKTEANIEVVDTELAYFEVVEVGTDVQDVFKKKDIVICLKTTGTSQFYNHKPHLWIDGRPGNQGGDVWAIVKEDGK